MSAAPWPLLLAVLLLAGCTLKAPDSGAAALAPAAVADAAAPADAPETADPAAMAKAPARPGLLALFRGRGGPARPLADPGPEMPVLVAAAPTAQDSGQPLPFGQAVPACGARRGDLGREVARYPAKGAAQWKLYDTDPTTTGPRSHYITGFADGCPRRVTGALALFGSAGLHETWRYRGDNRLPWSETDTSYEALKARICGTGRGTPCPAARLATLERTTAFVTLYPYYGAGRGWFVLLLSDRKLVAASVSG